LKNVEIRAEIDRHRAEASRRAEVSIAWVMDRLVRTHLAAFNDSNYSAAATCLGLLGKHLGMFDAKSRTEFLTPEQRVTRVHALLALGGPGSSS
jgi:hypothetical protein